MGTWGTGTFDNDDAWDWVNEFCDGPQGPGLPVVVEALTTAADYPADEYLELPECGAAIAAAEVIAALNQQPNPKLPEDLQAWVTAHSVAVEQELKALALRAIERVKADSEMQELWEDSEHQTEYHAAIGDLEARLQATGTD